MSVEPVKYSRPQDSGYIYSTAEKLKCVFPCVRQRLLPKRNLFAGPYAGEFGYELMQWQAIVRARRPHYEQVHVFTYPGRDYLYEGCQIHHHDIDLKVAGYWYGFLKPHDAMRMAHVKAAEIGLKDYDVLYCPMLCTQYHKTILGGQNFRLFEEPPLSAKPYDVAFHFRAVKKDGHDPFKNYSPALCDELAEKCQARGLSVACIGHPAYAYCPPGCADHRNVDLRQTVAAICSARVVAGENSGPMHLANICGKPTILWAQDQWRIDFSLRWNPFRVPIYIAANDTCQPAPERVCQAIVDSLEKLRATTNDFTQPVYTLPPQKIPGY